MPRFHRGVARSLLLALLLLPVSVACSPTANGLPTALPGANGTAQATAATSGGAASPLPSGAITDPAEAWPAFAACLRGHGLQVDDPQVDADGNPTWSSGDFKKLITPQIEADCGPILAAVTEGGDASGPSRKSYTYESQVAHAACMREHGLIGWPDPDPNDLSAGMPEGYDKRDPATFAALVACEHLLVETTASPSPAS